MTEYMLIKENTGTEKEKAEHNNDLHLWKAESVCEQMKTDKTNLGIGCIIFSVRQSYKHLISTLMWYFTADNLGILDSSGSYMALWSADKVACGSSKVIFCIHAKPEKISSMVCFLYEAQ